MSFQMLVIMWITWILTIIDWKYKQKNVYREEPKRWSKAYYLMNKVYRKLRKKHIENQELQKSQVQIDLDEWDIDIEDPEVALESIN